MLDAHIFDDSDCSQYVCRSFHAYSQPPTPRSSGSF